MYDVSVIVSSYLRRKETEVVCVRVPGIPWELVWYKRKTTYFTNCE